MTWLRQFATYMGHLNTCPYSDMIVSYITHGTTHSSAAKTKQPIFLFLLGEVCRNAWQTLGSVRLRAASPYFPASCSKQAERSSPPFPSLPEWEFCLPWLHAPHTGPRRTRSLRGSRGAAWGRSPWCPWTRRCTPPPVWSAPAGRERHCSMVKSNSQHAVELTMPLPRRRVFRCNSGLKRFWASALQKKMQ